MGQVCGAALVARGDQPIRLLVVEDEFLIRMVIADALRDAGYSVTEAVNGDEALDILRSGRFIDLILSDVRMPGLIDGLALLEFVRRNFPSIPVVLTSGHLSPEIAKADGAAQFLPKPYLLDDALQLIKLEACKLR